MSGTGRSQGRPTDTCSSSTRYKRNAQLVLPAVAPHGKNLECRPRAGPATTHHPEREAVPALVPSLFLAVFP